MPVQWPFNTPNYSLNPCQRSNRGIKALHFFGRQVEHPSKTQFSAELRYFTLARIPV